jgi:hypothetical protein
MRSLTLFGAAPLLTVYIAYTLWGVADHTVKYERVEYPYFRIRKKPYPWPNSDCDLINDRKCKRAGEVGAEDPRIQFDMHPMPEGGVHAIAAGAGHH